MHDAPKRIQRKRSAGWRMPENTISVCRPGKYGNPFVIGGYFMLGDAWNLRMSYTRALEAKYADSRYTHITTAAQAVDFFRRYREANPADLRDLRGKDLACWCKLDQPCHADVLLELANAPVISRASLIPPLVYSPRPIEECLADEDFPAVGE